ncbi:hypothetical protein Cpir12675_006990 [Ceratocystis pirilliformis]|uniref:Uncharacterized protein n=1 Tax=Ceratocystis pirilliformis TaxID=259994 RepID=A0ABR3YBL0_9PEZI
MDPNLNFNLNMPSMLFQGSAAAYSFESPPNPNYGGLDIEDASVGSVSVDGGSQSPPDMLSSAEGGGCGGSTGSASSSRPEVALLRKKKERRGHTKSRRGCFNCKRRRIKVTHQPHNQIPLFSLLDMRFFQHFLAHSPNSHARVWSYQVPYLCHMYDYLMHAVLGLAATDLVTTDPSLNHIALSHRHKAVQALKRRLNDVKRVSGSMEETNALIATCYALTHQSVLLDDGMVEFMVFVRGILIVGMHMWMKGLSPIFSSLQQSTTSPPIHPATTTASATTSSSQHYQPHHHHHSHHRPPALPLLSRHWIDMASTAVSTLQSLCHEPLEIEYQHLLSELVATLYVSSDQACKVLRTQYRWWMTMPHHQFCKVINPTNQVMVLLNTHWIGLNQMLAAVADPNRSTRQHHQQSQQGGNSRHGGSHHHHGYLSTIQLGGFKWLKYTNRLVDYTHQFYNTWPTWVEQQLLRDPNVFSSSSPP